MSSCVEFNVRGDTRVSFHARALLKPPEFRARGSSFVQICERMLLLCCKPAVEAKVIGYIHASLTAANILACIEEEFKAAFMDVANMANGDMVENRAIDESWWSRFPAAA
jgi:hypothetical protein